MTMPWANGAGTTREVAKASYDGDSFDWRLSFADVGQSGPFSALPGIDRVITLVEGTSMTLTVDGDEHVLLPFEPYAFAGEAAVDCATDRPTVDFNVMTRRGRWTSAVESRAEDKKAPLLFVPLAGPLLYGSAVDAEGHGMFWLSVLSAGQVAGVITALVGFTSTTDRLYRNDVLAQPAKPRVDVAPILTAHFQGVGLSGVF